MSDTSIEPADNAPKSAYAALKPVLQRFVDLVQAGEKPTQAVRMLRPTLKRPDVQASKWLALPEVKAARAEIGEQLLESIGVTQQMLARELARIAFGDPRELFDEQGRPRPIHELSAEQAAMLAGFEVIETRRDGAVRRKYKIKRWDKRQAIRDLAELGGVKTGDQGGGAGTIFNIQINL